MQVGFLENTPATLLKNILLAQIGVLRWCAEHNVPVFVLEYGGEGATVEVLEEALTRVPRVTRFTKLVNNGFAGTDLDQRLGELQIKALLFMGVFASECLLQNAQAAKRLRYQILTGRMLTMDKFDDQRGRLNETFDWYSRNGTLFHSEQDLIDLLVCT